MADESDRLAKDLASPEFAAYVDQGFWEPVERDKDILYVLLHAPDGRSFLAKLDCGGYRDEPISGTFVDAKTRELTPAAWPDGNTHFEQWIKFKGSPWFICWDQDRQGIQHHADWKIRKSWQKKPNQVVAYLDFIREMLHVPARGYNRQKSVDSAS
jgi:hypothetical protein